MTTTLSDIAAATSTYLHDQVEVRISRVTANLEPREDGTFTVRVTNAAAPTGVRMSDLYLHLNSSRPAVALLKSPGSALLIPRATADLAAPKLARGTEVSEMFIFFAASTPDIEPNSNLEVGEVLELQFEYHAVAAGEVDLTAHVHASITIDDLFPVGRGGDTSRPVTILP